MNQMKACSGGQRECRHLPSCVTHLFVYAFPPTLFDSVTVRKDLIRAFAYQTYTKHIGPT